MTATAHSIVGAVIATKIPDLRIALPLALLSHYLGDKLPHWDPMVNYKNKSRFRLMTEAGIDALLGLFIAYFFFVYWGKQSPLNVMLGSLVAQSPDWLEIPHMFFKWHFPPFTWVYRSQHWAHDLFYDSRAQAPWGVITQLIVLAIFLFWLLK